MTVNVSDLRSRLRVLADEAAATAVRNLRDGDASEAAFNSGRQAAFVTALWQINELEEQKANEIDEAIGDEARRLGLIGESVRVDIGAVESLEEFARTAGGAVDAASGTVYSDAEGGL